MQVMSSESVVTLMFTVVAAFVLFVMVAYFIATSITAWTSSHSRKRKQKKYDFPLTRDTSILDKYYCTDGNRHDSHSYGGNNADTFEFEYDFTITFDEFIQYYSLNPDAYSLFRNGVIRDRTKIGFGSDEHIYQCWLCQQYRDNEEIDRNKKKQKYLETVQKDIEMIKREAQREIAESNRQMKEIEEKARKQRLTLVEQLQQEDNFNEEKDNFGYDGRGNAVSAQCLRFPSELQ